MIFGLMLISIMATGDVSSEAPTADAMQSDLQTAYACKDIDGRKVWKGGLAYYIQSFMYDGQTPDSSDEIATDAVLPADNTPETMKEFEEACHTLAPTASKAD